MLPLDSPRWNSFRIYFDLPQQVPQRLASWRDAIGGPDEDPLWTDLREQFLHQGTITDAAYAAIPYLVQELDRLTPTKRFEYLVDVGLAESARQTAGAPVLPPDLADAYHAAIVRARQLALECLSVEWSKVEFRYLLSIIASLHGHGVMGDLLFSFDTIWERCPSCGELVHIDELQKSGYAG